MKILKRMTPFVLAVMVAATALAEEKKEYYWLAFQRVRWETYSFRKQRNETDEDVRAAVNAFVDAATAMVLTKLNQKASYDPKFDPSAYGRGLAKWKPVKVVPDFENNQVHVKFVSLHIELAPPIRPYVKGNSEDLDDYTRRYQQEKQKHPDRNYSALKGWE